MVVNGQKCVAVAKSGLKLMVGLMLLGLGLLISPSQVLATSNSVITAQVCAFGPSSPELNVDSPAGNSTVSVATATLQFSGRWLSKVVTKRGSTTLATTNLTYGDNQTFSQTITLVNGANNLTFEITGGCPEANTTQAWAINYNAIMATINYLVTNVSSPTLSGAISSNNHQIWLRINGNYYQATNHGDGSWTLPIGTIAPPLADGSYAVELEIRNNDGVTVVWSDDFVDAVVINTVPPTVTIDTDHSDQRSPELTGEISDPHAMIEIEINGQTYTAINNGDGTWTLPAETISALASGTYPLAVRATDEAGNVTTVTQELTIKAKGEIGFIIPPNTGFLRIGQVNIPSWLLYLGLISVIVGVKLLPGRCSFFCVSKSK